MSYTNKAIEKAQEYGYLGDLEVGSGDEDSDGHGEYVPELAFLDPQFWQSLGKAMGWKMECPADIDHKPSTEPFACPECNCSYRGCLGGWADHQHDLITHLQEGKDAESWFEQLLK